MALVIKKNRIRLELSLKYSEIPGSRMKSAPIESCESDIDDIKVAYDEVINSNDFPESVEELTVGEKSCDNDLMTDISSDCQRSTIQGTGMTSKPFLKINKV